MKRAPRVGVFGLLGSGNLGNDGSLEAVLGYLRAEHPDAVLTGLVGGPDVVRERYGVDTTPLHWNQAEYETASGLRSIVLKDGRAYLQAGAGIVADSDPASEYQETVNKAKAMVDAISRASDE